MISSKIKTIYQDDAPPEHEILYVVGLTLPPTMLDVTSFEGTVITREHPNTVNLAENMSNDDEEDEDASIDSSVELNIKPVDVGVVRATPLYRKHFAQRFNINELVSQFPALTSTGHKEKSGCIEMGLVMILHNIELTDGDSNKVFHVEGGNQLTRCRNYLQSIGFLRIREPKDEEKSARLIRWNSFRGLEGLGLDDQFPINLRDCPMFGNYAQALPMSSHPEVAMVKYVNVIFISTPLDDNMSCNIHPGGCGWALNYGRPVKVDAGECQLIKGRIWNVAVREMSGLDEKHNITLGCKIAATLPPQPQDDAPPPSDQPDKPPTKGVFHGRRPTKRGLSRNQKKGSNNQKKTSYVPEDESAVATSTAPSRPAASTTYTKTSKAEYAEMLETCRSELEAARADTASKDKIIAKLNSQIQKLTDATKSAREKAREAKQHATKIEKESNVATKKLKME
eukprot:scaffold22873_cov44-Cyclotella_meneghiniana.AAC.4